MYSMLRNYFQITITCFENLDWEFLNKPSTKEFRNWEECIYTYYTKHRIIVPYYKELKNNAEALIISLKQSLL